MQYPNIEKAHLEIAYDNGGINRGRSEEMATEELRRFLPGLAYRHDELAAINEWLGTLDDEQLSIACAGEQTEMDELLESAPPRTGDLLTEIFDHVC